jgi:hypothetical protein
MNANNFSAAYFQTVRDGVRERATAALAKVKRQPRPDFETVVYVTDQDGEEWEIRVGISYDCTYDPGVYSGPWEDSYPASGDMDLTAIVSLDDLPQGITDDMVRDAAADCERITDEAWDDYHSKKNERYEP